MVGTIAGGAATYVGAQEMAPLAARTPAASSLWSLERPGSNTAPYLTIGMTDTQNTTPGSEFRAPSESMNRYVGNTVQQSDADVSAKRPAHGGSFRLVSSLAEPIGEANGQTNYTGGLESTRSGQSDQSSPNWPNGSPYSLLDNSIATGGFLYAHQTNYPPSKSWSAERESFMQEPGQTPSPVLQFEFGPLHLPVMLSSARVSQ
jgi:hypothetical protein